jgi:hypothetical protein
MLLDAAAFLADLIEAAAPIIGLLVEKPYSLVC